jgi:hypothetical protein
MILDGVVGNGLEVKPIASMVLHETTDLFFETLAETLVAEGGRAVATSSMGGTRSVG